MESDQNEQSKSIDKTILEYLKVIPSLGWLLLTIIAFFIFLPQIKKKFDSTSKASALGIELEFFDRVNDYNSFDRSIIEHQSQFAKFTNQEQHILLKRIKILNDLLREKSMRILWLDDEPTYSSIYITPMLEAIGFEIDNVSNTKMALEMISMSINDSDLIKYDIIITDYNRTNIYDPNGKEFADAPNLLIPKTPIILFTYGYDETKDGVPKSIFGVTHDAYNLLHLILDATERN